MEQSQIAEQPHSPDRASHGNSRQPAASQPDTTPQASFIFAVGRVEPRFPGIAVEKEFAQTASRVDTSGQSDRQVLRSIISERANRYLARQLCWVFSVQGIETYLLVPRDPADIELLIEAVRADPGPGDLDVVVGVRGPVAPPEMCNGLTLPIVGFDQLYSFDRQQLIEEIPRPDETGEEEFATTAGELLDRIIQITDNAGSTDEHRALNYVAVRYPAIYARTAEAHRGESALTAVEVQPSRLSSTRRIVDVIFSYTHRRTDVTEQYFARIDVTDEFPFLVTKLTPYYAR